MRMQHASQVFAKDMLLSEDQLSGLGPEQQAIVDWLVLMNAQNMVGYEGSSFSATLVRQRQHMGMEPSQTVIVANRPKEKECSNDDPPTSIWSLMKPKPITSTGQLDANLTPFSVPDNIQSTTQKSLDGELEFVTYTSSKLEESFLKLLSGMDRTTKSFGPDYCELVATYEAEILTWLTGIQVLYRCMFF